MANKINRSFKQEFLYTLSYPHTCPGCSAVSIPMDQGVFCTSCLIHMPLTDLFVNDQMNKVVDNFRGRMPIDYGAALLYFQSRGIVQEMMHNFKYKRAKRVGYILGKTAGEKMMKSPFFGDIEIIVPVPLFWKKRKRRGYNQSEIFGLGVKEATNIWVENALTKLYDSESQTSKTRAERESNVEFHFAVKNHKVIKDKHVLLVDDVITTGSTLASAGNMLLQNGARKISVLTMAVALH